MSKLELPSVTLFAAMLHSHPAHKEAIERCQERCQFAQTIIVTDDVECEFRHFAQPTSVIHTDAVRSYQELSVKVIASWPTFILSRWGPATHTLTVHPDGWVVNPEAWSDEFLKYDYIGAPWWDGVVGNGGFTLRSRKFWKCVRDLQLPPTVEACHPEDALLCRYEYEGREGYRHRLERMGVLFAPPQVARRFSAENQTYAAQFGFHGPFTQHTLPHY